MSFSPRTQHGAGPATLMDRAMTFSPRDRVRHRRGWYGTVIEDHHGAEVLVRFDDGTPHARVKRDHLWLVEALDAEVLTLIDQLGALRGHLRFDADEASTIDRTIDALSLALTEHGLRVRVAAEIDRLIQQVVHLPFEEQITKAPRVRQWFADGARWALQQLRERANQEREQNIETETPPPNGDGCGRPDNDLEGVVR